MPSSKGGNLPAISEFIRLLLNLQKEFIRGSIIYYTVGVFFLAVARLVNVMVFFLPLKIIIIISEKEVPSYLQFFPFEFTYPEVLSFFLALIPIFYIAYFILGICSRWMIDASFAGYKESEINTVSGIKCRIPRLYKIHNRSNKILSEVFLLFICLFISVFFDFYLAGLAILVVGLVLVAEFRFAVRVGDGERVTPLRLHRRQFSEYLTAFGFLFMFAFLTYEAYMGVGNVYETIFMLLTFRLMFQSINRLTVECMLIIGSLYK